MLNFMLQVPNFEQFDYSTLKWMMTGAAPVPPTLVQTFAAMGVGIQQVYGLTETCGPACLMDAENAIKHPASTGKAFFHTEIMIADDDGNEVPRGTAGEVLVKGEHIMVEYWNRPEARRPLKVAGCYRRCRHHGRRGLRVSKIVSRT